MARPYSKDLRERVVGSVAGGRSCRATAALFGVSVASVVKWSQRYRATGTAAAKPMGGHRQQILRSERDWLLTRIAEKPDLTLRAVLAELATRGMVVSYGELSGISCGVGHDGSKGARPCRVAKSLVFLMPSSTSS
jgi:transposase